MSEKRDAVDQALPARTRVLLLHAALWDTDAPPAGLIAAAVPGAGLHTYAPAERAGLISIVDDTIVFGDPLIPAAVRRSAGAAKRRSAHRRLAAVLAHDPGRQAWHRACAQGAASAERARLFRRAGSVHLRAGRYAQAARSLRRAAEDDRSPAGFLVALEAAGRAGDTSAVTRIWAQIRQVTADPLVLGPAAGIAAGSMILDGRPDQAFGTATGALAALAADGRAAARLVSVAGLAVLASGSEPDRARLVSITAAMPAASVGWARLAAGVATGGGEPRSGLAVLDDPGVTAWLTDDTPTAVRRLRDPLGLRPSGSPTALPLLLALFDGGYWREAGQLAERLAGTATPAAVGAGAAIVRATLAAMRGDGDHARALLADAGHPVDLAANGLLRVLAQRARALAAVADGDYRAAVADYASLFDRTGTPAWHWSADRLVGEFAVVARRVQATARVRPVIERMAARTGLGARTRLALHLASGLAGEPGETADRHLRIAATDPAGAAWPVERAIARLQYASHLRRQRRFTEATPLLSRTIEDGQRFGARVFVEMVRAEMRANGAVREYAPTSTFTGLTAQQQHIVRLAATGLRNREIAERLSMSERTVGSHLYHVYPKLGVTGRNQLRKVLRDAS